MLRGFASEDSMASTAPVELIASGHGIDNWTKLWLSLASTSMELFSSTHRLKHNYKPL
jgi:hypothetical protein